MKKILGLLIALGIAIPSFASIAVSPTRIEINANKIKNNYAVTTIDVKGDMKTPVRFKIYPEYFTITNTSEVNFDADKNDSHNLTKNIRFVPSEFTVPPGKSQKVRINIANVKALPDGESRAMLFFEDVNLQEYNVPNNAGIGAQLILKTRVGVPVYVDKGNFTKKADIEYFKAVKQSDGVFTEMKILSNGNSKIRYEGKFQIVQGKKLIDEYNMESHVVANNGYYVAKQRAKLNAIKEAGDYTIRAVLCYMDENNNKKYVKKETVIKITGEKI